MDDALAVDEGFDFFVSRKAPERLLRVTELAVDSDFEHATTSWHKFYFGIVASYELVPRTEGIGFIVSLHAIFNSYFHTASV